MKNIFIKKQIKYIAKSAVSLLLILVMIGSQQAAAFTEGDFYCANQGGTCFYDPNDACSSSDAIDVSPGSGDADGLTFPNLDPSTMADALNKWMVKANPNTSFKDLGSTIVATAKNSNVSPFLMMSIARKESSLGDPGVGLVQSAHNSFGRTATPSQPHITTNRMWYQWSSIKASVDYTASENKSAKGGGDMGSYMRRVFGDNIDKNDLTAVMKPYAPPSENDTVTYINEVKSWLKELADLAGGTAGSSVDSTPISDEASTSDTCSCSNPASPSLGKGLDKDLQTLAESNGGKTSIAVSTVDGSKGGNSAGDRQMPTRSSYKAYTAYGTLKAIEEGKISWSTRVWGNKTVEETMQKMIINSNNDAAEALRTNNTIGSPTEITKLLQEKVGLSDSTVMGSGKATDTLGSNSQSTANDYVKFLLLLYKNKLPGVKNKDDYDKLLGFMKRAATNENGASRDGIVAGVGNGVEVADKPGWAGPGPDQASNDVGIVYRDNAYVVAILTDKPNQWEGVAKIAKGIDQLMKNGEVKASIDETSSPSLDQSNCENTSVGGDLNSTIKAYAWKDYHSAPFVKRMPAYAQAITKAVKNGQYVGGSVGGNAGIDCGGFVTRLMIDSGFEPEYNFGGKLADGAANTYAGQEPWLTKHWKKIDPKSTKDLEPGDVAINWVHTYVYVGKVDGFNSTIASASYSENGNGRAPMAGHETPADSSFNWYRKK